MYILYSNNLEPKLYLTFMIVESYSVDSDDASGTRLEVSFDEESEITSSEINIDGIYSPLCWLHIWRPELDISFVLLSYWETLLSNARRIPIDGETGVQLVVSVVIRSNESCARSGSFADIQVHHILITIGQLCPSVRELSGHIGSILYAAVIGREIAFNILLITFNRREKT